MAMAPLPSSIASCATTDPVAGLTIRNLKYKDKIPNKHAIAWIYCNLENFHVKNIYVINF